MSSRLFALLVGIDKYKSGRIWNLESCVDDAQCVRRWLMRDLQVPHDHIRMLTDAQATKTTIEDGFSRHLLNNPAIQRGDAIVIYFAGHGSSIPATQGWHGGGAKDVEVICPYDHDSKSPEGRVAGISDRSFAAMLKDLADAKGDNITVILDCCFSPAHLVTDRKHTRWAPTMKATAEDLSAGLWRSARGGASTSLGGFARSASKTHIVLAACSENGIAREGKSGGAFTAALLSVMTTVPLHNLTYPELIDMVEDAMDGQEPVLFGEREKRILFNGAPFAADPRFVRSETRDGGGLRVGAGAIHGVTAGTEFTIHEHNFTSSHNPPCGVVVATEVYTTWCLARPASPVKASVLREGWARVARWNNVEPFRVHLQPSFFSLFRRCRLSRILGKASTARGLGSMQASSRGATHVARVKHAADADVSVALHRKEVVLDRRDSITLANSQRLVAFPSGGTTDDTKIVEAASRFHLHLYRRNYQTPLAGLVSMELYRLDPQTWTRVGDNLLVDGRAQINHDDKSSFYTVVLRNKSEHDLWPYVVNMDPSRYGVSMVYHPDKLSGPPLRKHSEMTLGSGTADSEVLSFALADGSPTGTSFVKLFVSTAFTHMDFIEQGVRPSTSPSPNEALSRNKISDSGTGELWDTLLTSVTIVRS